MISSFGWSPLYSVLEKTGPNSFWDLTAEKQFITPTIIKLLFFLGLALDDMDSQKTNPTVNYNDIKKPKKVFPESSRLATRLSF